MINKGVVVGSGNGMLRIMFERQEACGDCHNCMHGSDDCNQHMLDLPGEASIGDLIEVEMDDSHFVAASMVAYLIPLLGFLVGLVLGYFLSKGMGQRGELVTAGFALLGTGAAYLVMRVADRHFSEKRWKPRIIRITHATWNNASAGL